MSKTLTFLAATVIALGACSHPQEKGPRVAITPEIEAQIANRDANAPPVFLGMGCLTGETNAACEARQRAEYDAAQRTTREARVAVDYNKGWTASPEMEAEIARRDGKSNRENQAALEAAAREEYLAHAQCSYQAQMANVTTPGLLSGFLAGISAGVVCQNYYRDIGMIR